MIAYAINLPYHLLKQDTRTCGVRLMYPWHTLWTFSNRGNRTAAMWPGVHSVGIAFDNKQRRVEARHDYVKR
jgi:hypothetical protein